MGEMKGGIIRIVVLDMLSLKWALILNEDQTEVQEYIQQNKFKFGFFRVGAL